MAEMQTPTVCALLEGDHWRCPPIVTNAFPSASGQYSVNPDDLPAQRQSNRPLPKQGYLVQRPHLGKGKNGPRLQFRTVLGIMTLTRPEGGNALLTSYSRSVGCGLRMWPNWRPCTWMGEDPGRKTGLVWGYAFSRNSSRSREIKTSFHKSLVYQVALVFPDVSGDNSLGVKFSLMVCSSQRAKEARSWL